MSDIYDVVIIGGGPAGLTAGIYSARARMKALLLEKVFCGGQILVADRIENYPGFPEGVKGPELAEWMLKQAENCGLRIKTVEAREIRAKKSPEGPFSLLLNDGSRIDTLSIIIATGAKWNALGIPGEAELTGKGVSYCATCDGPLFKAKDVAVIGGGNTAVGDALFLSKFASRVTIVHRRERLRAAKILQERAMANPRIAFCLDSVATEVIGQGSVKGLKIRNVKTGAESIVECSGIFVLVGLTPNSGFAKDVLKIDEKGYIIADDDMKTSAEGIFACGDVRKKSLRQVVTATGEGAAAAFSAEHYVDSLKGQEYR